MSTSRVLPSLSGRALRALALTVLAAAAAAHAAPAGDGRPCDDSRWQLADPATARLGPGREAPAHLRIEPATGAAPAVLAYRGLVIGRDKDLLLALRLRADAPRRVAIALVEDAPGARNLGLAETLDIGPAWRDVVRIVIPHTSARSARLRLDFGAPAAAVEIDTLVLRRRASSRVESVLPPFADPVLPCPAPRSGA